MKSLNMCYSIYCVFIQHKRHLIVTFIESSWKEILFVFCIITFSSPNLKIPDDQWDQLSYQRMCVWYANVQRATYELLFSKAGILLLTNLSSLLYICVYGWYLSVFFFNFLLKEFIKFVSYICELSTYELWEFFATSE